MHLNGFWIYPRGECEIEFVTDGTTDYVTFYFASVAELVELLQKHYGSDDESNA
jgi:hypothetical protein